MTIAAYIVVAAAMSITDMLLFRRCAEPYPVRLSTGLTIALIVALVQAALYMAGIAIGDLLRLESTSDATMYSRPNAYISLGLFIIVILKFLLPYLRREPKLPTFNIQEMKPIVAMAFATGINMLLIGIAMGFASQIERNIHVATWPMLGMTFLFSYFGIMFGRQKVTMRPRRWMIVTCVLLLGTAIAAVVNS